jgi:hypothetical protein
VTLLEANYMSSDDSPLLSGSIPSLCINTKKGDPKIALFSINLDRPMWFPLCGEPNRVAHLRARERIAPGFAPKTLPVEVPVSEISCALVEDPALSAGSAYILLS